LHYRPNPRRRGFLSLKEVIEQQGFEIYNEEKGDFTFIEAREL
jgi:hypothetical protein